MNDDEKQLYLSLIEMYSLEAIKNNAQIQACLVMNKKGIKTANGAVQQARENLARNSLISQALIEKYERDSGEKYV